MATEKQRAEARRLTGRIHRSLADDIRRLREDAGLKRAQLAAEAGVDLGYLCRIEDGTERPSLETYVKVSFALGSDLSARIYPNTGPSIRDRHQARILETLVDMLHPRWRPYPEVAVRRPSRGWIDVVLHDERGGNVIATEIESDLRRLEQLLRWIPEKVASLPSWEGWAHVGPTSSPSRLLIVRSTRATRSIASAFATQLNLAYPGHPADALAALTGIATWPGAALIWAHLEPSRVTFSARRGVRSL